MIVDRRGEDGRQEFVVIDSRVLPAVLCIYALSFVVWDILDFPFRGDDSPSWGHFIRWQVVVWISIGSVFWAVMSTAVHGESPRFLRGVYFVIGTIASRWSSFRERTIVLDSQESCVRITTRSGGCATLLPGEGRVVLQPPDGTVRKLRWFRLRLDREEEPGVTIWEGGEHYLAVRRLAERVVHTLGVPLVDEVVQTEEMPGETDLPLWKRPVDPPEGSLVGKEGRGWRFRRVADGFQGVRRVKPSFQLLRGVLQGWVLIPGYFWVARPGSPHVAPDDYWAILVMGCLFGGLSFWICLLSLMNLLGGREEIRISSTWIRYGTYFLGRWWMDDRLSTQKVERILVMGWTPDASPKNNPDSEPIVDGMAGVRVCTDEGMLYLVPDSTESVRAEEEKVAAQRFAQALHWMIRTVVVEYRDRRG